ncbi:MULTISPECIES: hypothetical protein [Corallococcus]|uniref:hypothetical protein n=1 Tax=Corallococcus TaxID=83461 RepID=UPI00117F559A|nr:MULTISPECIES: hypothetical protein [Corallococcus]NBD10045.1 hypothetical protein [Corallococcus silvisoli]TSC28466.1 hypothetical protein FOF48_17610 [Corallococcus sp. Z5C101001]
MQFTLTDDPPPMFGLLATFLLMFLFLVPWVALPLVLWLRRGARDSHDVLSLKAPSPWTRTLGIRELMGWACSGAVFMGPLLWLAIIVVKEYRKLGLGEARFDIQPWSIEAFFSGLVVATPVIVLLFMRWLGQGAGMSRDGSRGRVSLAQRLGDLVGWTGVTAMLVVPSLFSVRALIGVLVTIGQCYYFQFGPPPARILVLLGLDRAGPWDFAMILVVFVTTAILLASWRRLDVSPQDVLRSVTQSGRSFFSALQDFMSWACIAALFIGPLLLGMAFLINVDGMFLDHFDETLVGVEPNSWGWFAAMTLLLGLLRVRWLRTASTRQDVLHIA